MNHSNTPQAPSRSAAALAVLGLIGVLAAGALQAQTVPVVPPVVLPRLEPAVTTPTTPRPLDLKSPDRPPLAAPAGLAVRVDRFTVSGATRLPQAEIDAALAPFSGRSLDYAQLQQAANALTDAYRRAGYLLALAYLPEQRIADGTVELAVLEGQLGSLTLTAADGLDGSFAQQVAQYRLGRGEVVSEANLVRNLIVLNELPGFAIAAAVRPGAEIGTADVAVDARNVGVRWAGAALVDNHGTPYIGRVRFGASATGTNLSGRGDLLSLRALVGEHGGQHSLAAAYLVPVHASGTRLGVGLSALDYTLGERYAALQAHGTASIFSVQVEQPLLRSFGLTLDGRALLAHKALRDRIDLFASRNDRHLDSLQLGLAGELRDAGGRSFWTASATAGRVDFDDATAASLDATQLRTAGAFTKINLELGRQQLIAPRFSITARGLLQLVDGNLDSSERVTFNGANALRPFGALPTAADEALQIGIDARYVPEQNLLPGAALVAFFDAGRGHVNRRPLPGSGENHFNSVLAGIGAEAPLPGNLTLRASLTREHVSVRAAGDAGWASRAWFELIKSF